MCFFNLCCCCVCNNMRLIVSALLVHYNSKRKWKDFARDCFFFCAHFSIWLKCVQSVARGRWIYFLEKCGWRRTKVARSNAINATDTETHPKTKWMWLVGPPFVLSIPLSFSILILLVAMSTKTISPWKSFGIFSQRGFEFRIAHTSKMKWKIWIGCICQMYFYYLFMNV